MEMKYSFDNSTVKLMQSSIQVDSITNDISKMFDYTFEGTINTDVFIPEFPDDFSIGIIYGSSGSGKSTILRERFGEEESITWDNSKCIASHFRDADDASNRFGAVGLNSVPTWLKPYNVLSNGEKFRADMARRLKDNAVIDEFTSVVNREVAISCSMSIEKYIRKNNLHNIVFCSCHDDILPYLKPDWVYNTDTKQFYCGRYLQRPQITIEFSPCKRELWSMFKKYHYLSGDLNSASKCFVGTYNDIPVVFISMLALPGGSVQHAWRVHRFVVMPDYQGMGIGSKTLDYFGQKFIEVGCRFFIKTTNPRIGLRNDKSSLWRRTSSNLKSNKNILNDDGTLKKYNARYDMKEHLLKQQAHRVCYSHEYVGDGKKYPYAYKTIDIVDNVSCSKEEVGKFSKFSFDI